MIARVLLLGEDSGEFGNGFVHEGHSILNASGNRVQPHVNIDVVRIRYRLIVEIFVKVLGTVQNSPGIGHARYHLRQKCLQRDNSAIGIAIAIASKGLCHYPALRLGRHQSTSFCPRQSGIALEAAE